MSNPTRFFPPASVNCESTADAPADRRELSRLRVERQTLEMLLKRVESRLGTEREEPDDLALARFIAHQLNNVLTAERLLMACANQFPQN